MTRVRSLIPAALLVLSTLPAAARDLGGPRMGPPAFLRELFLPALVMEHQREIALTDEQREAITRDMAATQEKVLRLRWGLEEKGEALRKLLAAERVDEKTALARAGEILDIERQVKQAHLELLIRIKNRLTAEQQEKLRALRPRERFGRRFRGGDLLRRGQPAPEP